MKQKIIYALAVMAIALMAVSIRMIEVNANRASVRYTSFLDANAYGARAVWRMNGLYHFELPNGEWIVVNQ